MGQAQYFNFGKKYKNAVILSREKYFPRSHFLTDITVDRSLPRREGETIETQPDDGRHSLSAP